MSLELLIVSSRAIACTKDEYETFNDWRIAKGNVVSKHQTWIDSITKTMRPIKDWIESIQVSFRGY